MQTKTILPRGNIYSQQHDYMEWHRVKEILRIKEFQSQFESQRTSLKSNRQVEETM